MAKIDIQFVPASDAFLKKHGNTYCPCCRREGKKVLATHVPAGRYSVTFKKEYATCAKHLADRKKAAERDRMSRYDDDDSEAMYQIRSTYGI